MTQPDPETLAGALTEALSDQLQADENTATPHDVIAIIDDCLAGLHALREAAVREHRRRTDRVMVRSGQLLGHVEPEVVR